MKVLRKISIISLALLFLADSAMACPSLRALVDSDFEVADIVFEGKVDAIHPTIRHNSYSKNEQITAYEITFRIDEIIRGELHEKYKLPTRRNGQFIRVGWKHGTFGYPSTYSEFVKQYGMKLRVGLTTHELFEKLCPLKDTRVTRGNEQSVIEQRRYCDIHYTGFSDFELNAESMPYILNGPCTGPYMLPLNSHRDNPARDKSKLPTSEGEYWQNYQENERDKEK